MPVILWPWSASCGTMRGYMDKLCTRTLYDLDGSPRVRVDEYMKRRLQSRLIRAILNSP